MIVRVEMVVRNEKSQVKRRPDEMASASNKASHSA